MGGSCKSLMRYHGGAATHDKQRPVCLSQAGEQKENNTIALKDNLRKYWRMLHELGAVRPAE